MSIQKTMQKGGEEPLPQSILELQQLALGMFLIWDTLGNDYHSKETVERSLLSDWTWKHKIDKSTAIKLLVMAKERFGTEPWAHYMHCRNFNTEGWANMLLYAPNDNADVLEQIRQIMDSRPFGGEPAP